MGCYVGTGGIGLALIVVIASRCIGGSKAPKSPEIVRSKIDPIVNAQDPTPAVQEPIRLPSKVPVKRDDKPRAAATAAVGGSFQAGLEYKKFEVDVATSTVIITWVNGRRFVMSCTVGQYENYDYPADTHCLVYDPDSKILTHVISRNHEGIKKIEPYEISASPEFKRLYRDRKSLCTPKLLTT